MSEQARTGAERAAVCPKAHLDGLVHANVLVLQAGDLAAHELEKGGAVRWGWGSASLPACLKYACAQTDLDLVIEEAAAHLEVRGGHLQNLLVQAAILKGGVGGTSWMGSARV